MEKFNVKLSLQEINVLLDAITLRKIKVDELITSFNSNSELDLYLIDLYNKEKEILDTISIKLFYEKYN